MSKRRAGKRHILLPYQRMMTRLAGTTFFLALALTAANIGAGQFFPILEPPFDLVFLGAAVAVWLFTIFAFVARKMTYVQARPEHLRVVTPFLRLNISYRRILNVHPTRLEQLFPPQNAKWAQRRYLEPFYGKTVVVIMLTEYPMSLALLRFFLPPQMFTRATKGLVFIVADWMALSSELDSAKSQAYSGSSGPPGKTKSPYGILGNLKK